MVKMHFTRKKSALEELLPTRFAALLDDPFDFLRSRTSGDEQGVRHVDDDEVIYTQE